MASFKNIGVGLGIIAVGFAAACEPAPRYIQAPDECKGDECDEPASSSSSSSGGTSKPGSSTSSSSSSSSSGGSTSGGSTSGDPPPDPPPAPPLPSTWKDTIAYTELAGGLAELTIKLTSYAGSCALEAKGDSKKNGVYLKVAAKKQGANKIAPGTYKIGATGTFAEASENRLDGACIKAKAPATAGTLVIDSVGATVKGSYDLTLPSGPVKGTFDVAICDVPDGLKGACVD